MEKITKGRIESYEEKKFRDKFKELKPIWDKGRRSLRRKIMKDNEYKIIKKREENIIYDSYIRINYNININMKY